MGRPRSGLDDYLEWQQRLESYKESGLTRIIQASTEIWHNHFARKTLRLSCPNGYAKSQRDSKIPWSPGAPSG